MILFFIRVQNVLSFYMEEAEALGFLCFFLHVLVEYEKTILVALCLDVLCKFIFLRSKKGEGVL